ncbi:MAG TPA: SpoIIE family protein phosphatase [Actinomycetota bacterium]
MGVGTVLTDWGVAARGLGGSSISGDRHVVAPFAGGALVAVIDGLGHGPEAAEAAEEAVAVLSAQPQEEPVALIERCHERLRKSRGAVVSVASIEEQSSRLHWLGVGNVEGVLVRPGEHEERSSLLVRGGVVGYRLPRLLESAHELRAGDTLLMATDGIRPRALREVPLEATGEATAKAVLHAGSSRNDDALVLAAVFGEPS